MSAAVDIRGTDRSELLRTVTRALRRNAWTLGLFGLLIVLLGVTRVIQPSYGASGIESLAKAALPIALVSVGQAIVVIAGGIDLSVASMMALTNVTAASLMGSNSDEAAVLIVLLIVVQGLVLGTINGLLVVLTRVPDIVVTLAMSFVWAGAALLVLSTPSGSAPQWLRGLYSGTVVTEWLPKAFLLIVFATAIAWIPLRRTRTGLAIYAVGSDKLAAFRSGVDIRRTKTLSYALCGLFAALGGLAITMATGTGIPVPGPYTLASVAAVVLGGVSLVGGRGGLVGVVLAVFILRLVRADLVFLGIDPNFTTVIEGLTMVIVVMVGALLAIRRRSA